MKIHSMIKTAAVSLCAVMMTASCDVETTTVMFSEDNDLSQPTDTVFSVLGILSKLQHVVEPVVVLGETRGDLVSLDPLITEGELYRLQNFDYAEDTTYNRYSDFYAVINNCNYFLSRAETAMERRGKQVFIKEYAAVSAIRAWTYLQLAKIYGEVPFYTHPLLTYSDIEQVANDRSNRKGMADICSYFIEDLQPFVDTPYPDYGDFTYAYNSTVYSRYFFFPVRLLLGDLLLWRGSCTGSEADFARAAQYYHDYLLANEKFVEPEMLECYNSSDFSTVFTSWRLAFASAQNSENISFVPMASSATYGYTGTLAKVFSNFDCSESLQRFASETLYCFVAYTREGSDTYPSRFVLSLDSLYYGTKENPQPYYCVSVPGEPVYTRGDLRLYSPTNGYCNPPSYKYYTSNPHVVTYRTGVSYLRLAEAINRAGYPLTAFNILKYGLSRGNLIRYDANGEYSRLMASGYTFYDMGDNTSNIGIHARGCGNAEMDTLNYSLPAMATRADSVRAVEDLIINELALESAYEGNRFYDLMRFAFRRGNEYLASRVARRDYPEVADDQISSLPLYSRLIDRNSWYLPVP